MVRGDLAGGEAVTTYRLPDTLGGGEVEEVTRSGSVVAVVVRGGGPQFEIHRQWLTMVAPPLPPEPPVGAVVNCNAGYVHIRQSGQGWTGHDGDRCSWPLIQAECGGAIRLIPDPVAAAPALPWADHYNNLDVSLEIGCGCNGQEDGARLVRVKAGPGAAVIDAATARQFGLAVLAAATEQTITEVTT